MNNLNDLNHLQRQALQQNIFNHHIENCFPSLFIENKTIPYDYRHFKYIVYFLPVASLLLLWFI